MRKLTWALPAIAVFAIAAPGVANAQDVRVRIGGDRQMTRDRGEFRGDREYRGVRAEFRGDHDRGWHRRLAP
jgi:hypothetical protein